MKKYTIDIHPSLENVEVEVKNGASFERAIIKGEYKTFNVEVSDLDIQRVRSFAVKHCNDYSSGRGKWYAHCNGYAMNLSVLWDNRVFINSYRNYGKNK